MTLGFFKYIGDSVFSCAKGLISFINHFDRVIFQGGRVRAKLRRTGNPFFDKLIYFNFKTITFLENLDSFFIRDGRKIRAIPYKVRSQGERLIANWLYENGIKSIYEKKLKFADRTIKPDFYLPKYNIYIEFWGRADICIIYQKTMAKKLRRYKKSNIRLISLYPQDASSKKKLNKVMPEKIKEISGKTIKLRR